MNYTPCRVFCVGMNYAAHIRELRNEIPAAPVIFMKPPTCLLAPGRRIPVPAHGSDFHYETEVVALIGREGRPRTGAEARAMVSGITLGLDLTLRDVQAALRKQGHPWEACKAFDGSAPLGDMAPCPPDLDLGALTFTGRVNGVVRQEGNTADMVFPIPELIVHLARMWTLKAGDLLYTGTPAGVGPLRTGDTVEITAPWCGTFAWTVGG